MDIALQQVEYRYQANTPFEKIALKEVNLDIKSGSYLAIIGHTGSGKSTLLQHLNALIQPTKGKVIIGDRVIDATKKEKKLRPIRQKVGIVFQFPEHQLFEETVEKDICFGPLNFGADVDEAKARAREAIQLVGLSEDILTRSPFDLSGGQMRRVAIACVLAMNPDVLVLDEPTAGLDPRGRREIMDMFYQLYKEQNISIVLVTHSMEDAARYADQIIVMHKGTIYKEGTPREIFSAPKELMELGLDVPQTIRFQTKLEEKLQDTLGNPSLSLEQLVENITAYVAARRQK